MNRKLGMYSSITTLLAVLVFSLSMVLQSDFGSYFSSMFIAWGFVPMICAFASYSQKERKAAGYTAVIFAAVYTVFIMVVYFTQLTVVRLSQLNVSVSQILDYKNFGLFFNFNLLGYGFMALATFFIALTLQPLNLRDKWLKALMLGHGIFAVSCVTIPMLGIFNTDMAGGDLIGILVLEFWCAYFAPICILSYLHFRDKIQ